MDFLRVHLLQVAHQIVTRLLQQGHQFFGDAGFHILRRGIARSFLFRAHLREQQHLLDLRLPRDEHHQTVDANADARGGRHAVLQCAKEVLVDEHRLVVALLRQAELLLEAFFLVDGVVQLRVSVGQLLAVHHQFEAFSQSRLRAVLLRQGRHLHRIVRDESGLDVRTFAELAEDFVDELALAHRFVGFHLQFLADFPDFLLSLPVQIIARLLLYGFEDGQAAEGSFEADHLSVDHRFRLAVHRGADMFQQFFGKLHHPVVILVLHIQFHAGKFRVVAAVHTLVAEVLADFVDTLETAHDEAFQVKLCGDAQVEVHVERVMVRDERSGAGTSGDGLEDGRFHFRVAGSVKELAHGFDHLAPLEENLLHAGIDQEVDVALAVAQFRIVESVVGHAVLLLHHGQRPEAFREEYQLPGVNGDFACLSAEHIAFHADEVAQVEQFFEERVIERFVLSGADVIAGDVHLDAPFGIHQFGEAGFAHHASSHQSAGNAHLAPGCVLVVGELCFDVIAPGVDGIGCCGIRFDAHFAQFLQGIASLYFLFAEF